MKPQIGSLVGKESGHALHSSTTNVSIRNAYSSMVLHLQDLGSQDTLAGHDPSKFSSKYVNDLNRTSKSSLPALNGDFSLNEDCQFPNMPQSSR